MAVMDFGKRKIFILKRDENKKLAMKMEIPCRSTGDDIVLDGNRLLISGYITDKEGKSYDLYFKYLNSDKVNLLLPTEAKYGLGTHKEFLNINHETAFFSTLGRVGYCDIHEDSIYFVWHGNLNIFNINSLNKKFTTFGKITANYIKPYVTNKMKRARRERNLNISKGEKKKMSFIQGLFVSTDYICLIYEKAPNITDGYSDYIIQFYSLENNGFLKEVKLEGFPSNVYYFDKASDIFYSMSFPEDEEEFILKYKISK